MKKLLLIQLFIAVAGLSRMYAQLSIANAGTTYTINFDNTVSGVNNGAFTANTSSAGLANTSPAAGSLDADAWAFNTSAFAGAVTFGNNIGNTNTGGTSTGGVSTGAYYAFDIDPTATTNRAFGIQQSGGFFQNGAVALRMVNNTGSAITELTVNYKVFVRNDAGNATDIRFYTSTDNSTYTEATNLNLGTGATLQTSIWKVRTRKIILTGLNIANGASYYVRWGYDETGSGTRDEIALDDIQITGTTNPVTYYYYSAGNTNAVASWDDNPSGAGSSPANFTDNNQVFVIDGNASTAGGSLTISGTNSKLIVGRGYTSSPTLTVTSGNSITGTVDLNAEGKIVLEDATIPTFGTINCKGSRVDFGASVSQTIPEATYRDLRSSSTGDRVLANSGTIVIEGDFSITGSGLFTVTGSTINFASPTDSTTIPVPSVASGNNYNNITFSGAGSHLFLGSLSANAFTLNAIAPSIRLYLNNAATGKTYTFGNMTLTSGTIDGGTTDSSGSYTNVVNCTGDFSMSTNATYTNGAANDLNMLIFSGSGVQNYTRTGSPVFQYTNIIVASGATLNTGTNQITTVSGEGTRTIYIVGTLQTANTDGFSGGSTSTIPNTSPARTIILGTGSTIEYNAASGTQFVTTRTYQNIRFSGAGTKLVTGAITTITGIDIAAGTVDVTDNTFGGGSTNLTMSGGRFIIAGTGSKPDANGTYTLTGGVIEFTNTLATGQSIRSPKTYYGIEVTGNEVSGGSGNYTLANNGSFTVNTGGRFTVTDQRIVAGTGTSVVVNGTFRTADADGFYGSSSTTVDGGNTISFGANGTVTYNRSGAQAVTTTGISYHNLTLTGSGNKTLDGTLDVNGNLIDSAGTLITSNNNITLGGNWTVISGAGFTSGTGTVTLDGTVASQTLTGSTTFNNLTLNNTNGGTIAAGAGNTMSVAGVYTHTAGTLTTNNNLTLAATSSTAYGQIAGTGSGSITGNVNGNFILPATGTGKWRGFSSPFTGNVIGDLADDITLNFGTPSFLWSNVYSLNEADCGDGAGNGRGIWQAVSSASQSMDNQGFSILLFSGDLPTNTTVDLAGTYTNGDYTTPSLSFTNTTVAADSNGWHLIRNPWPSNYNHNTTITNLNANTIYLYEGTTVRDWNGAAGSITNGVVPPYHAMLVKVTASNTLTFPNANRTTTNSNSFHDKTSLPNYVALKVTNLAGIWDETRIYSDNNAENGKDVMDAVKVLNNADAPTIYTLVENNKTSINLINNVPTKGMSIPVAFTSTTIGKHTMSFTTDNVEPSVTLYLEDLKDKKLHKLENGNYTFEHNASNVANRFVLHYNLPSSTSVNETAETAMFISSNGNSINVSIADAGVYNIEVIDLLGRTVTAPVTFNNGGNSMETISVNNVSAGYYLVKVTGNNGVTTTKVFLN